MDNIAPTRKITAVAFGGAVATIVAWALGVSTGLDVPVGVESAFAVIVATGSGYLIREEGHA